jgi:hypothetical protein
MTRATAKLKAKATTVNEARGGNPLAREVKTIAAFPKKTSRYVPKNSMKHAEMLFAWNEPPM